MYNVCILFSCIMKCYCNIVYVIILCNMCLFAREQRSRGNRLARFPLSYLGGLLPRQCFFSFTQPLDILADRVGVISSHARRITHAQSDLYGWMSIYTLAHMLII